MPVYTVSCRGNLSGGAIVHLREAGMYVGAAEEHGLGAMDGKLRHEMSIEATSPEDAILVARGALAVAGAEAHDFTAEEAPPA